MLVGEIRDAESLGLAVQGANTGHLVPANNTKSCIKRLRDTLSLDQQQSLFESIECVISQRLVGELCQECSTLREPSNAEIDLLKRHAAHRGLDSDIIKLDQIRVRNHKGCDHPDCNGGITGRIPINEVMDCSAKAKEAMMAGESLDEFIGSSLFEEGLSYLKEGKIDIKDVML